MALHATAQAGGLLPESSPSAGWCHRKGALGLVLASPREFNDQGDARSAISKIQTKAVVDGSAPEYPQCRQKGKETTALSVLRLPQGTGSIFPFTLQLLCVLLMLLLFSLLRILQVPSGS